MVDLIAQAIIEALETVYSAIRKNGREQDLFKAVFQRRKNSFGGYEDHETKVNISLEFGFSLELYCYQEHLEVIRSCCLVDPIGEKRDLPFPQNPRVL